MQGTDGNDIMYASEWDPFVDGMGGNDTIYGSSGNNVLGGQSGNDWIFGAGGQDTMYGGSGDDWLGGGPGNDKMYGGESNDVLRGDSGIDLMWGDTGADVFDFNYVSDSPAGARDWIVDFSQTEGDKIDLSGIDAKSTNFFINDAFTFIGNNEFTGAAGQLRFEEHNAFLNNTTVSGDVNGDGSADFEIVCLGLIDFTAADFLL